MIRTVSHWIPGREVVVGLLLANIFSMGVPHLPPVCVRAAWRRYCHSRPRVDAGFPWGAVFELDPDGTTFPATDYLVFLVVFAWTLWDCMFVWVSASSDESHWFTLHFSGCLLVSRAEGQERGRCTGTTGSQ